MMEASRRARKRRGGVRWSFHFKVLPGATCTPHVETSTPRKSGEKKHPMYAQQEKGTNVKILIGVLFL